MSKEIWFTITPKGSKRAWFYSRHAGRAIPMKMAEAELGLATGTLSLVAKPEWVGK
jgi:hypothetical protein